MGKEDETNSDAGEQTEYDLPTPPTSDNEAFNGKLSLDGSSSHGDSSNSSKLDSGFAARLYERLGSDEELLYGTKTIVDFGDGTKKVNSSDSCALYKQNPFKSRGLSDEHWKIYYDGLTKREPASDEPSLPDMLLAMKEKWKRDLIEQGVVLDERKNIRTHLTREVLKPMRQIPPTVRWRKLAENEKFEFESDTCSSENDASYHSEDWFESSTETSMSSSSRSIPSMHLLSISDEEASGPCDYGFLNERQAQSKNSSSQIEESMEDPLSFKVVTIGDVAVGKTSIIQQYCRNVFLGDYRATIGVDTFSKKVTMEGDMEVSLSIWDIAGNGRMNSLTRSLYRGACGAVVAFDATRTDTLMNAVRWRNNLNESARLSDGSPVPCVLVANKCDLEVMGVVKDKPKMDELCKRNKFLACIETSAKTGMGIKEAYDLLINEMMKQQADNFPKKNEGTINLAAEEQKKGIGKRCLCG